MRARGASSVGKRSIVAAVALAACAMGGCAGAVRSDAVTALADREKVGLGKVTKALKDTEPTVAGAADDLKASQAKFLTNLGLWDRQVKRANIIAASPGDLQNKLVREAVFTQLAQLELDNADDYAAVKKDFAAQVDAMVAAYSAIVAASAKAEQSLDVIREYLHASPFAFGVRSIDIATVQAALEELEGARGLIQKAATAGDAVDSALAFVRAQDRGQHLRNATDVLSLISSRLKELKQ